MGELWFDFRFALGVVQLLIELPHRIEHFVVWPGMRQL